MQSKEREEEMRQYEKNHPWLLCLFGYPAQKNECLSTGKQAIVRTQAEIEEEAEEIFKKYSNELQEEVNQSPFLKNLPKSVIVQAKDMYQDMFDRAFNNGVGSAFEFNPRIIGEKRTSYVLTAIQCLSVAGVTTTIGYSLLVPKTPNIPVGYLVLTGVCTTCFICEVIKQTLLPYICKPYSIEELVKMKIKGDPELAASI
jgi:hypothetical protein